MLSPRMAGKILDKGHVGTRIAWVRIKGPVCNLFYIVVYVPHKGRAIKPRAEDTIRQLENLLQKVKKSDCVIMAGDFNCQLQRSVQGCTGKWCMTRHENKGHGNKILDLMRLHDLCAAGTYFKPKRKKWRGRYRHCNATYIPKDTKRRPTKLDYICVSNRWKSKIIRTEVKWSPSIHRFGHQFDHGLVSTTWRWRTKKREQIRRPDFKAMDEKRWAAFDDDLRIRITESRQTRYNEPSSDTNKKEAEQNVQDPQTEYANLTKLVRESIEATVPAKAWTKKNGRIVSEKTKALYEARTRQFQANKPTQATRKKWNRKIRSACKQDYRTWITGCTERIENADNRGDTKAIYDEVKRLSGLVSRGANTRPTAVYQEPSESEETGDTRKEQPEELVGTRDETAKNTRSSNHEELVGTHSVTAKNTRNNKSEELGGENENAEAKIAPPGESAKGKSETNSKTAARARARVESPAELASNWQKFLQRKFSATEIEKMRADFEALPTSKDPRDELKRQEFDEVVRAMKKGKANGADGIPAEVWANSSEAKEVLYTFLQKIWQKEEIPENLAVCIFIMIYKNKGSKDDYTKYRAIGLLNHAYKIMTAILLRRLVVECAAFFSEWQAGFRSHRGCRDNILLLRMLYDQVINNDDSCVITYIDYTAAFDSISHKFLDRTLAAAGASRKSRAIFRAIYRVATGIARVRGTDGTYKFSGNFKVSRGVVQGDIISPVLFILALDQLVQSVDKSGTGVKCGRILHLRVLGYADDAALIEPTVEAMTKRLTDLANASMSEADMKINMTKTFSQHVHKRKPIKVTADEVAKAESKYVHKCDFCERKFKTNKAMHIHRANCVHNYATTQEVFAVEKIVGVFGHKDARWFQVKWEGYEEPEWEREHLLKRDKCHDSIRSFWATSGLKPTRDFYPDTNGENRCTVCARTFARPQDLKAHRTRTGHHDHKQYMKTRTAVVDAITAKRKEQQKLLPRVKWGDKEAVNQWRSKYLGSMFEAGGDQMYDVQVRIARARQRFGKMRHIWGNKDLHVNLRLRLYKSSVCSILTYGSEAWRLTPAVCAALNGANSSMVSKITGRPIREEATEGKTFDLLLWIRARKLQWLGHIMRMGTERKLKHAIFEMYKAPQQGDMLMDAPATDSWRELWTYACDREYWKARVRALRQPRITTVTIGPHHEAGMTVPFTVST